MASLFHHGAPPPPPVAAYNKHALCVREGRETGWGYILPWRLMPRGLSQRMFEELASDGNLDREVGFARLGKTHELQVRLCAMTAAASTSSTT